MTATFLPPRNRGAWLEIDLDAMRHNIEVIRSVVGPAAVAPVVKADAYGHGVEAVGPALAPHVEALCVATLDEAIALRARVAGGSCCCTRRRRRPPPRRSRPMWSWR